MSNAYLLSRVCIHFCGYKSDQLIAIATIESRIKYTAGILVVFDRGLRIKPTDVSKTPANGADGIIPDRSTISGILKRSVTKAMNSNKATVIPIQSANSNFQLQRRSVCEQPSCWPSVQLFSCMFFALTHSVIKCSSIACNCRGAGSMPSIAKTSPL